MNKILPVFMISLGAFACQQVMSQPAEPQHIGMANPASVYCVEQKGTIEIVETPNGQHGMCHLSDGRVIEEWEFWRANNPPTPKV